jgi:hypothetical protein
MSVTDIHEEKETLVEDFNVPGHEDRTETPLFVHSRHEVLVQDGARCFVCGETEAETGHPLELHHVWIERSLANGVTWSLFCLFITALKKLVDRAYDFCQANPNLPDIMTFVDDARINGMILCLKHHVGKGTGIHFIDFPHWLFQCFGQEGYQYTPDEKLHHG